jgi:HEPN domain-containing protein
VTTADHGNHARRYLHKAQEYLDSAQDNLDLERATPAAGDAIHAGISAKDAIVTALTGATSKAKDHAKAVRELRQALGVHTEAAAAERALRDLVSMKGDVEYGTTLITLAKAEPLVRRARSLVDLAATLVRAAP